MQGLMQDRPLSLAHVLDRAETVFGHKTVVTATVDGEVRMTFAELTRRARRLAAALEVLDCPTEARIGTFGWNSHRHLELYLGVPCSGRVLHTINHRLFAEQVVFIVNDAADDVLFVDRSILPVVWRLMDQFDTVRWVVVMDDGGAVDVPDDPRVVDYEALLDESDGTPTLAVADENHAASLCYTSGTTANPKGVLYSHRSVLLHALLLLMTDSFAIGERDVVMPIVPMFHVNAWGLPYTALLCGAELVLPGPAMSPDALIGQMRRHRVTFGAAVATIWRTVAPLLQPGDLPSLRMLVSGGGAVPDALSQQWQQATGVPLTNAWGMTETSPVVTSSRVSTAHAGLDPDARRALQGSPGPCLPLTSIRIIADDGTPSPWDGATPGELQVAGPTIASSYFGAREPSDAFTSDGWLRTGDVATIDPLGYMRIVDRTKDLVKSGGEWISSVTLENEIMAEPRIAEAAVIGEASERWGERPVAYVVARHGADLTPRDVQDHLRTRVASWWIPETIRFVADIPKTATGKVSKKELREKASAGDEGQGIEPA